MILAPSRCSVCGADKIRAIKHNQGENDGGYQKNFDLFPRDRRCDTRRIRTHAQEIKLSAINYLPHAVDYGAVFMKWVEEVNQEGAGKVKIEVRPFGTMPVANMANAARSGVGRYRQRTPSFLSNAIALGRRN